MLKRLLSLAIAVVTIGSLNAQQPSPQGTPLPLNPKVKAGVLPNGLHYYVMHNEEPKERANFYIAQKVGSTLETPEQLGLAHFLEHMAFNGTTHYPGKAMLNYLQSKGIRFGADINAYTGFDETVYNINSVPTTDKALMDSVLLVLRDWSDGILLEESEINSERGVIEGEWRQRNTGQFRMFETILPSIYKEYQYQQMPIGKMEIVRTFPPQVIRDYYKKWYRPDQQGIVVVGDFDADEMEKKIIALFSDVKMPENAAERTYPAVSDNEKPIFVSYQDPEMTYSMAMLSFKEDKLPFEQRNTMEYYVQEQIAMNLFAMMINNRLAEYAQKPECAYADAGVYFGDFMISKTKAAFNVNVAAKNDIEKAFRDAMAVVARACKTGFTDSELVRARDEMKASYEKAYNEREKTSSDRQAQEIIRHFIDNEPAPGIEMEYNLIGQVLPAIPVEAFNMMGKEILTDQNQVLVVALPESQKNPGEEVMIGALKETINAPYEAYVDEVITDPIISKYRKPGKVKSVKPGKYETTEMILSNGVKVIVKNTDFAQDEILMTAFREGGLNTYPAEQAANLDFISDVFDASKLGNFDVTTLRKYLSGKRVGLSFGINPYLTSFSGTSTVKDLPTLMELVYASFTSVSADNSSYESMKQSKMTEIDAKSRDPQQIFFRRVTKDIYGGNPLMMMPSKESLEKASYPEMLNIIKNATANAADYTFIFTGNVDAETLKPLLEKYVASLPAGKVTAPKKVSSIAPVTGIVDDVFTCDMKQPSVFVYDSFIGYNVPGNIENSVKINATGSLLDNKYVETLREEMGGTYGASVMGMLDSYTGMWNMFYFFQTNADQRDAMLKRAYDEMLKLFNEGTTLEDFTKVKEAQLKQYDIQVRRNGYWLNNLRSLCLGHDNIGDHKAAIENMTLEGINSFMKTLYDGKNRVQVIMDGVSKEAAK